jgi:crotonobetainyl-CoA:carnitine CoA-transferase CaiB-like acyl-CoA transferase
VPEPRVLPLDDLVVLEIGYGVAAPVCCRNLAEFGADVVKVESARRPDSLRTLGGGWMPPNTPWAIKRDAGIALGFTCPEKRSIGLEIEGDAGASAFRRLVARADVLVMNMSVDAVEELGLGYQELRALNPRLVHMNMAAFGSDGPYRSFRTWGGNLSALSGITELVGWPDRDPVGIPISFSDYIAALWGTVAVVAAIMRRDATGQGCEIGMAQYQAAIACIGPTVTQVALGGDVPHATGARRAGRAPHGIYPSRGDDRWVAITVLDDAMWEGMCRVRGLESLAADPRFSSLAGRLAREDALDEAVGAWTRARTEWEAADELQREGVAAAPVTSHWDVLKDPHLAAREFFRVLPSQRFRSDLTYGQAVVLSATPARFTRAAPSFGQHTRDVLSDVGYTDTEIDALVADGVAHVVQEPELGLERPFLSWIPHVMPLDWPPSRVDAAQIVFDELAARFNAPTGGHGA